MHYLRVQGRLLLSQRLLVRNLLRTRYGRYGEYPADELSRISRELGISRITLGREARFLSLRPIPRAQWDTRCRMQVRLAENIALYSLLDK